MNPALLSPADQDLLAKKRAARRVENRIQAMQDDELQERISDHLCTCDMGPVLLAFRTADYLRLGELIWDGVARQLTEAEAHG